MQSDLILNASRHCKQKTNEHMYSRTAGERKIKNPEECLNVGDISKCGDTSARIHKNSKDKIKKFVNLMKQARMIKRLSVFGSQQK